MNADVVAFAHRPGWVAVITAVSATLTGADVIPRGGGAVAILIAGIVVAVIAGTVALETRHNMVGWMISAFVATILVLIAAVDILT